VTQKGTQPTAREAQLLAHLLLRKSHITSRCLE